MLQTLNDIESTRHYHFVKIVCIRSYSGPYFPVFGLNTGRYGVSLRIQSKCGKIQTRITPNTDNFHAVYIFHLFHYSNESTIMGKMKSDERSHAYFWWQEIFFKFNNTEILNSSLEHILGTKIFDGSLSLKDSQDVI